MIKKKIIYLLVSIAFVLLIINIVVESYSTPEVIVIKNELSRSNIEEKFITSLWDYGIIEQWITAKPISNQLHDSLKQVYYIDIPADLQVVNIITGISERFEDQPVKLVTEERINHSNSTVKIYSNGVLKLEAFIDQSDEIHREYAEICFIVKSEGEFDEELEKRLAKVGIPYTFLFTPSVELKNELGKIVKLNPSHALLISDAIEEDKYELDADDNKSKLTRNVINIISDFGRKINYILDQNSLIYKSIAFPYIRDEFEKRNITLTNLSDFHDLRGKPLVQLRSILKFHCENGKGKQKRFLLVNQEDFIALQTDIKRFKKLGNIFLTL